MDMEKKLRSGFTTGTCAAAAAKAAALMVFTGRKEKQVSLALPGGEMVAFEAEQIHISQEYIDFLTEPIKTASCFVRKFAGDDPDVTDGAEVFAKVSRIPLGFLEDFKGYIDKPVYYFDDEPRIFLTGGTGIGIVTKKGLSCEPGTYAINPGPRKQIFDAVREISREFLMEHPEGLFVEISIPQGIKLAEKTFNPHLGIVGGISVLGTSGIVNPMSEQALLETIRLDIRVKTQNGRKILAVSPGNYGENFVRDTLGISMDSFVKCSNFVGETFRMMKDEEVEGVLLAGHIGKLIKVAGGVLNTHSKYGDRRMEIFNQCAISAGMSEKMAEKLLSMNTTEEAVDYLIAAGYLSQVIDTVLFRIQSVLEQYGGISTEVVVFSSVHGILGMTDKVKVRIQILT